MTSPPMGSSGGMSQRCSGLGGHVLNLICYLSDGPVGVDINVKFKRFRELHRLLEYPYHPRGGVNKSLGPELLAPRRTTQVTKLRNQVHLWLWLFNKHLRRDFEQQCDLNNVCSRQGRVPALGLAQR